MVLDELWKLNSDANMSGLLERSLRLPLKKAKTGMWDRPPPLALKKGKKVSQKKRTAASGFSLTGLADSMREEEEDERIASERKLSESESDEH